MIELSLEIVILLIGLIYLSINFRSIFLSLLTGIYIAYLAMDYTQISISFTLLLIGYASVMFGYAMAFNPYYFKRE